jgi:hypothetical protein
MDKTVRLGTVNVYGKVNASVFCHIRIEDGRLSISGVEGPKRNGDALGSCGQIDMHLREAQDTITLAPGWDKATLARFFDVWKHWHLNDMKAGTPAQEAELDKHTPAPYPKSHYEWALETLHKVGPFTVWCYDDITEQEDAQYWAAALTRQLYRFKRSPKVPATSGHFETREAAENYAKPIASGREAEIRGLECDNGYKYGSQ